MDKIKVTRLLDKIRNKRGFDLDDFALANELMGELRTWLNTTFPADPKFVHELSYRDAISYFIDSRPKSDHVTKGAMLRSDHRDGTSLVQVFLDKRDEVVCGDNGLPFGRRLTVGRLDDELAETFGKRDLVIVE
ncbi:hypothetical protein [Paractinoplanes toevensis]|uniref:Uncharacterized protein n=1 Tax=Paractinoplanes toevensis TaxID=571911 RepID=A0A919T9Y3_9ACTN|nr:hypothetical protein [Actinoplanes toevensis]GIM91710.1 hypothetical protein Ato02nite_035030 [Actinoplanes toevensis]